jgi:glycosyltransferase involved in cell wall biosynthesis
MTVSAGTGSRDKLPVVDDDHPGWLCFSAQDWWMHNQAHSDFQLMRRIARTRRVLLVNSIGMRMPMPGRSSTPLKRVARKARSVSRAIRRPDPEVPGFHVMTPLIVPAYGSARGRALNAALVRAQVTSAMRWLGIDDPVCMATIPTAWDALKHMRYRRLVVNRSDKHSAFREADSEVIASLERELLAHADVALYVSHSLMDEERALSEHAEFLDHGVDLDRFVLPEPNRPDALAGIARPRIGFVGGINGYQIDVDLFRAVADACPDAELVLVGSADVDLTDLLARPNVHWLGRQPYEAIPRLMASVDVALMPWQRNEWIEHANPIKIKEYLAIGLPVVSTPYAELDRYADVVRVAADRDQFVRHVTEALAEVADRTTGDAAAARRRAAVLPDSWDRRADELLVAGEPELASDPAADLELANASAT